MPRVPNCIQCYAIAPDATMPGFVCGRNATMSRAKHVAAVGQILSTVCETMINARDYASALIG